LSRKLTETEASFTAVQGRLRHAEASINEANIEHARLVTTIDEINERYERERSGQNMRFDSLQSRATTLEKVVGDARELLLARAEQIREYDRRNSEIASERDALHERVSNLQAALIEFESKYKEADQIRSSYLERNETLARAFTAKEAALTLAEDANGALNDRLRALEAVRAAEKQAVEQKIEGLDAMLRREKLARALAEGALDATRRDYAKAMREVMALQRDPPAQAEPARPRAANAA
jgi:crescentin